MNIVGPFEGVMPFVRLTRAEFENMPTKPSPGMFYGQFIRSEDPTVELHRVVTRDQSVVLAAGRDPFQESTLLRCKKVDLSCCRFSPYECVITE